MLLPQWRFQISLLNYHFSSLPFLKIAIDYLRANERCARGVQSN